MAFTPQPTAAAITVPPIPASTLRMKQLNGDAAGLARIAENNRDGKSHSPLTSPTPAQHWEAVNNPPAESGPHPVAARSGPRAGGNAPPQRTSIRTLLAARQQQAAPAAPVTNVTETLDEVDYSRPVVLRPAPPGAPKRPPPQAARPVVPKTTAGKVGRMLSGMFPKSS